LGRAAIERRHALDPTIREVIDVSKVVENRIQQAYTRPTLKPMARASSTARRSTADDRRHPGQDRPDRRGASERPVLMARSREDERLPADDGGSLPQGMMKTVSGQFITHNTENDQYYLDLQKTIDHDAKIQDKADTLSDSHLDQYYFDALTRVLELTDLSPYVRGYQIWEHEIEWQEHKITRRGYLFFGAPNERPRPSRHGISPVLPPAVRAAALRGPEARR
jgi:hypothetical protein